MTEIHSARHTGKTGRPLRDTDPMGAVAPGDIPAGMLDCLPLGILILNGTGTMLYANARARMVLRASCQAQAGAATLAAAAQSHSGGGRPAAKRLPIGPGGTPMTANHQQTGPDRVTILLPATLSPAPATPRADFDDILSGLFGLTPTERHLAAEMSSGTKLPDIALARGVTLATIRTQMKSVYGKIGVTRQSDLVREMIMLQMAVACTASQSMAPHTNPCWP